MAHRLLIQNQDGSGVDLIIEILIPYSQPFIFYLFLKFEELFVQILAQMGLDAFVLIVK